MKAVAFSGSKGGTGKTTLSHALALGATWRGVPSYLCHTDKREPIITNDRPYSYYDARDSDYLRYLIDKAIDLDGLFIIDGGGNRSDYDIWIASAVDLVVIPVTPDPEDIVESLRHKERLDKAGFENVMFLINRFPSNKFERDYIKRYFDQLPQELLIGKISEVKSIKQLKESDREPFITPNTKINNLSRHLYRQINERLEIKDHA